MTQRRPEWEPKFSVVRLPLATTQLFVKAYLPFAGSGTDADVGFRELGKSTVTTDDGKWTLLYEVEGAMTASSRSHDGVVENTTGEPASSYGLTGAEKDGKVTDPSHKRQPTIKSKYLVGAAFAPAVVPDLTLGLSVAMKPVHTPKCKLYDNGDVYMSYETRRNLETLFATSMRLSPTLVVINETYYYARGFYERGTVATDRSGKPRYENIIRLEYTVL